MVQTILLVPSRSGVGLPTVAQGVYRAIHMMGTRVAYFVPIGMAKKNSDSPHTMPAEMIENYLSQGKIDLILEKIIENYEKLAKSADIIVVEGLAETSQIAYATELNQRIAKALDADVIIIASFQKNINKLEQNLSLTAQNYGGAKSKKLLGCIINKINAPTNEDGQAFYDFSYAIGHSPRERKTIPQSLQKLSLPLLGAIPWKTSLIAPRCFDVVNFLQAKPIHTGEVKTRRIHNLSLVARNIGHALQVFHHGSLLITASDRSDVILAASMADANGIKLAGLLLTGSYPIESETQKFCEVSWQKSGLPVFQVASSSYQTVVNLQNISLKVPSDDEERLELIKNFVAEHIKKTWIKKLLKSHYQRLLTPPAFRYALIEKARQKPMRIILPEGTEPRTIAAANHCANRGIAHCILIGNKTNILQVAEHNAIQLNKAIEIIEPNKIRENYLADLIRLRQHKKLTTDMAREYLQDNVVLATLMLAKNEVDGLVSGAEHTTANTIRPALQLIKTAKNVKLVSSIFFMCLPTAVIVFGDCAVNPDPSAEELADIAIQSVKSAKAFGIPQRVAMISYSTGLSGSGADVDKVIKATNLVKKVMPKLLIDGPLQYDAAINEDVAAKKAPKSSVAGNATILIFPDLNTGNTTYKAVQRSADILSVGPVLQGLAKPVNDLSRGASIDDIFYTIAITAIQAQNSSKT